MLEILKAADQNFFLFLNGKHNSFFDFIMIWASDRFIWIPFYAILLIVIIRNFGPKTWFILFLVAMMITVSDQVSSGLVKGAVKRLRPCHDPALQSQVHLVKGICGGSFGFFSSHASNSTALAIFLVLIFRKRKINPETELQRRVIVYSLISYALLVSYSRIYLGTHYPGDVITGIAFGSLLSFIFAQIFFRYGGLKKTDKI